MEYLIIEIKAFTALIKTKTEKINQQINLSFMKQKLLSAYSVQGIIMCPVVKISLTASYQARSS